MHPRHHLPPPNYRACFLLSLAGSWTGHKEDVARTMQLAQDLQRLREILFSIYKLASVSKDFQDIKEIIRMIQFSPMPSACILRWMECVFQDNSFYSRSGFLTVETALLQCLVTSIKLYPLQHHGCFSVLKSALLIPSDSINDQMGYILNQKLILDCFTYLIHSGFVFDSLEFIMNRCHSLDTGSIRHFVMTLLPSFQPPFSQLFISYVVDFLNNDRSSFYSAIFI